MRASRIQSDVHSLSTCAGRAVGTPGHGAARTFLVRRLRELALEGYDNGSFELPYDTEGIRFTNILARLPGTSAALPPLLLAAHYDTCGPLPGADDNAAAIAILLALVEPLRAQQLLRSVVFAFFDAEEPPYFHSDAMGSTYFYHWQRREEIHCAVVLDLMGHDVPLPGLEEVVFAMGMESDQGLENAVSESPEVAGIRIVPTLNRYVGDMSDHHAFRLDGRPYLFLSCGQWEHYHRPSDTPDKLSYDKINAIVSYLSGLVPRISRCRLEGPFEGYDSTPTELQFLRKHLGPLVKSFGGKLETRSDIDVLAARLRGWLVG